MKVRFNERGWEEYEYWRDNDHKIFARVTMLITAASAEAFIGIGKPEPLKGDLSGFWSRRITGEHRLVYAVEGKGDGQTITVISCRHHY